MIPPPVPGTEAPDWRRLAVAGALVAAVFAAYGSALQGPLVFDDVPAVAHAARFVEAPTLSSLLSPGADTGETTSGRPFLLLTLALNHALGGESVRGYHLFNVSVHALAALALFGIARRTFLRPALPPVLRGAALPLAAAVAGLWALHPLQTQAVTYVVQRAESLAGLFLLLTLYGFIRAVDSARPRGWLVVSVVACLAGAATKETVAVAPVMVLAWDRILATGSWGSALRQRPAYYAGLVASWMVLFALGVVTGGRGGTAGFDSTVSPWAYLLAQGEGIPRYLMLAVWPGRLVFDYGTSLPTGTGWGLAGLALLALLAGVTGRLLGRGAAGGFLGTWFFLALAPSSSVVPIASQILAEHRMYLALAAPVALGVVALHHYTGRWGSVVAAVLALALALATQQRNQTYRSELTLWADTVAKATDNARAWHNLARAEFRLGQYAAAAAHFERALSLKPGVADTHYNLGLCLARLGRPSDALLHYERALALQPAHPEALNNLGHVLLTAGRAADARRHLERALALRPDFAEARSNLSDALLRLGEAGPALQEARAAARLDPRLAAAPLNAGNAAAQLGRFPEARQYYETAIRLAPDHAHPHNNLANVLLELDQPAEAIQRYQSAIALDPSFVDPRRNLALLLLHLGRPREAEPHLEVLSRLLPGNPEIARALREARRAPDR